MTDLFPPEDGRRQYDGWGVQAYRAVVVIGLAVLGALSMRVIGQLDKTTDIATSLQMMTGVLGQRIDAQGRRIDRNDQDISWLRDRLTRVSKEPP